jgi:hypothetical protein
MTEWKTGRTRLAPWDKIVVLQMEWAVTGTTLAHTHPRHEWRNATPQDVMNLVAVDIKQARITA